MSANKNNHRKEIRARPEFTIRIVKIRDPAGVCTVAKITDRPNAQRSRTCQIADKFFLASDCVSIVRLEIIVHPIVLAGQIANAVTNAITRRFVTQHTLLATLTTNDSHKRCCLDDKPNRGGSVSCHRSGGQRNKMPSINRFWSG